MRERVRAHDIAMIRTSIPLALLSLIPLLLWSAPQSKREASPAASAETPSDLERGEELYAIHCSPCHGERGRGDGPGARFLDPAPRDFTSGNFRVVSTSNGVPSDHDLFEVISAGLPGTAMLGFAKLPPSDRQALIATIKSFRRQGLLDLYRPVAQDRAELESWVTSDVTPGTTFVPSPPIPNTLDSRARGRAKFRSLCSSCHGLEGRGDGVPGRGTAEGEVARPSDLSRGVLKGGTRPENLWARIRAGMPGTPMPSVPVSQLKDEELWDLIHYLKTIIPEGAQEMHDPVSWTLTVSRIEGPMPTDPDDPRLLAAPETHVALAPFRAPEASAPGLLVRAVHDGEHLIFRIVLLDGSLDSPGAGSQGAPDGLAARITAIESPPILPIPGLPLPLDRALWLSGPMPPENDPLFDAKLPRFQNPDNVCKAPIGPEKVGRGTWRDGLWTILLPVKPMRAGELSSRKTFQVSFAAFDGSQRRGPLPVAFSAWQELSIQP